LLDRRRPPEGGRAGWPGALLSAHRPRLSDRRGRGRLRRAARRQGRRHPRRHAGDRGFRRARDGAGRRAPRRGGAAVPGLRLLRPVRQLRGAGHRLPPPRPGIAGRAGLDRRHRCRPVAEGAMTTFSRADTSILGRWWWTVDRWALAAVAMLMFFGALLVLAASPAVAERIGLDRFALAQQHFAMLPLALALV